MTSDYEGISNALLEAMATGLPVIATDSLGGGARMLIKNAENGFLISRGNAKAFEETVKLCLSDSNMCMKISEYAKRVNFDYNANAIYKKWQSLIFGMIVLYINPFSIKEVFTFIQYIVYRFIATIIKVLINRLMK